MNLVAVIVTFEPDLLPFSALINSIVPQANAIVIVDNSSVIDVRGFLTGYISSDFGYIHLQENFGIAYAQNIGIQWARSFGADHVLLMDQDSVPAPDMVQRLETALHDANSDSSNIPVAAVGPVYVDKRTSTKSFFVVERNFMPRRWQPTERTFLDSQINVSFLISSGTLIPLNILNTVGGKRSNYFIDHVDTEWSFRARQKGFRLIGAPHAQMHHALGDKVSRVWFFGSRHVSHHSALRDYYMFRNTILMIRDVEMSLAWRIHLLWRLFQFAGFFLVFISGRCQRAYSMLLGILHGLCGKRGKVNLQTASCTDIPLTELDP